MRNYIYINEEFLNNYVNQIPKKFYPKIHKRRKTVSLGLTGIKVSISEEDELQNMNKHEKIELLLAYLKRVGNLEYERPKDKMDAYYNKKEFVLETMKATQVIFPTESLKDTPDLKSFVLWVSDPNPNDVKPGELIDNFKGTFLYITQMWLDNGWYDSIRSGCSALQAIVNYLEGNPILSRVFSYEMEKFGRNNFHHPIEKLTGLGAKKGSTKEIICLYRKRYITDEQCYIFNKKESRVNDLLAYPIFISEKL